MVAVVMAQDQPEVQAMEMAQVMALLVVPQAEALTVGLVLTAVVIPALVLLMVLAQDQREAPQMVAVVMAQDQPEVQAMEMAQVMAAVMALLVVP
ncbi:MAG TPA: hypothetical protein DGB85_10910, partial [Deltaproteobacteria bacterium]|nr:hypothetical protein [Deltaproteobacteria bacterium]